MFKLQFLIVVNMILKYLNFMPCNKLQKNGWDTVKLKSNGM